MRYAWVAAAVAGAATMALEVLTARRLAPAFGLTLSTWAVLIAATLLAGAVGALLGARFGGRPSRTRIAKALAIAAVAAAFDAAAGASVVRALSGAPPDLGAGLASLVLVGPAVAALAAVPPLAIALGAQDRPAGTVAGRVLAASTAGSLVGTLGVALVLLPLEGVARSTLVVAILCALTALWVARRRAAYAVIVAAVSASGAARSAFDDPPDPDVRVARGSPSGDVVLRARGPSLVLEVDGVAQGTRGPLVDGLAALRARGQASAALPILHPRARRALVIGLGAGALTAGLADAGLDVTTVDVNPVLVEVVAARWGIPGRVVVDDGRRASRSLAPGFDAVVLDAFQGEGLPWHLVTREAFEALRPRLAPGAIVVVHLVGRAEHRVTGAVAATLRATWAHGLAVRSTRGGALDDVFLLASDAPLSWPPHPELEACVPFEPPAGPVLTDDDSPLDRWNEPLARALRAASGR
ncbi:MAG: fused MFS/spermidine synthase [Planctomycetota bacterium]